MDITVQKFGGSSLATDEQVDAVADRVAAAQRSGAGLVVVVSARGDTTDQLLNTTGTAIETGDVQILREADQLLATGEVAAAAQLALALRTRGVPAVSLTGPQAGLHAEGRPGAGVITTVDTAAVRERLEHGEVVVVAGFQAATGAGDVITLGRGGSDTSAVALAAALGATTCEIYTDVEGIYGADPRVVDRPALLPVLGASVMAEMAFAGARVLHARAVELAAATGVDLVVRHAHGDGSGSTIIGRDDMELEHTIGVTAVTHEEDLVRVVVRGDTTGRLRAADVIRALAGHQVAVDSMVSAPPEDPLRVAITVPPADLPAVTEALDPVVTPGGGTLEVVDAIGKVSLIGTGLLSRTTLVADALAELAELAIPAECVSATQARICFTVPRDAVHAAVLVLYRRLCPASGSGVSELASA